MNVLNHPCYFKHLGEIWCHQPWGCATRLTRSRISSPDGFDLCRHWCNLLYSMYGVTTKTSSIASQNPRKGKTFSCDKGPHVSAAWHQGFQNITSNWRCKKRKTTYKYTLVYGPKQDLYFVLVAGQCSVVDAFGIFVTNYNVCPVEKEGSWNEW